MDTTHNLTLRQDIKNMVTPYIKIARPDHWFKNIFLLPGVALAIMAKQSVMTLDILSNFILGMLATCFIASSNYTINEILDAAKDRLHPVKKMRPIPSGQVNLKIAYMEWVLLGGLGLLVGYHINMPFFIILALLLIMGLFYNIPPLRLKDVPYMDVLSESVNNPIRLALGWYLVVQSEPPTLSLILAFWMIGAFFMATKRFAEYRRIGNPEVASNYRKSFSYYNEYRLILSIVYYASAFSLFFGIFLVRYRIELILSIPILAGFIPIYLRIGFKDDSPAQYPESLYRQKSLVLYTFLCLCVLIILLFIDIPMIGDIFKPTSILR
ncbi:MAG: UbiA family prenyltransferase [Bacteroidetes bacterium]|nr:UbiA family prenyltransferase [Bacteroidota bacterium]